MPDNDEKHYDLEPGEEPSDSLRADVEHEAPRTEKDAGPVDIESLDVCPNCGATMRGTDELVCLRCGFDLKSMKVIETRTGEDSVDEIVEEGAEPPPLSKPGRGDLWMPAAVAGVSAVVLIIGCAGGVLGLYTGADSPNFGMRLVAIAQTLLRFAVWGGAVIGALWCTARLINQQPLGEIKLVAMRALAAVAAINLVRFINLEHDSWEQGIELVLQAALLPPILTAMFGISFRDSMWTAIITIGALLTMVLAPLIVSWSI